MAFPIDLIRARPTTMWRYVEALPLLTPVTLGEGMTPLVPLTDEVHAKVEFASPTLSFKDRGASVVISAAVEAGAARVLTDSSGNAGTAIAAYAAAAGLGADVYVPAATSPAKLAQMEAHGARVHRVRGDRAATAARALEAAVTGPAYFASHVWNPWFTQGTKTFVFELWEQLGGRLPAALVLPAGNGTLVIGAWLGVQDLIAAGAISAVPRIIAVQAAACAPLAARGPVTPRPTAAAGIAIADPPRLDQMLEAIDTTGGEVVTVGDDDIRAARTELASRGLYVEPTAAVAWAAVRTRSTLTAGEAVIPLCGAGLKGSAED